MSLPRGLTRTREVTYWRGRPMIWFAGEAIHVDANVWAAARQISVAEAEQEIAEDMHFAAPGLMIHHIDDSE